MSVAISLTPAHACPLHSDGRDWPLTNCYVDVWVELLWNWGRDPADIFAFCVAQAFEGDHFTFFKPPSADLEALHGVRIEELPLWDDLERHLLVATGRGRAVLLEVDGYYLPDTQTTSYRTEHVKTTIAVLDLSPERGWCQYVHNSGVHLIDGEDYRAVFQPPRHNGLPMFAYAEMVWRTPARARSRPGELPLSQLRAHLGRRPEIDPIAGFLAAFPTLIDRMIDQGPAGFHGLAFNTFRQLGSAHGYLGDFLRWLDAREHLGLGPAADACEALSTATKVLQLRTARMAARRRLDLCEDSFDALAAAHARLHQTLNARLG